ncbi:cytochrome P450, partial [Staphylococcus coagulans]|uniref:cytochrome P450 n=1 Tax=Staphylococcus coagulans TaxID=74706 RepID=UPI001BEA81F4
ARDYLATLARQQPYGDVVRQRILRERNVDVFDPELLRRLMLEHADALIRWERGPEVFSQTLGQSVLVTEGPVWHRQRRLLMPAFAHKRMAGYAAFMVDAGSAGLDRIQPGPVEMSGLFSHITMDVILRVLFGT